MKTEMHRVAPKRAPRRLPSPLRRSATKLPWMLAWVAAAVSAQTAVPYPAQTLDSISGEVEYVSALGRYQRYADQPLQSWREANDQVGRIGGWHSYAKEAAESRSIEEPSTTNSRAGPVGQEKP